MGALHNWVNLQQDYDCYFFVADLHALTTDYSDPSRLKQSIFDIAIDFLAAGLNPGKCTMFIQSHVPQHAELHLLFSMFTPISWLERVPTYKDQQEQLREKDLATYGFLGYPLLQSADILLYKPEFVPVGADQVAHVELTREVARKFNHLYSPKRLVPGGQAGGDVSMKTELDPKKLLLHEPQVLLTPSPKLPGIDGRKMSKSYGNAIYLTDSLLVILSKTHGMSNGGQRPTQRDPGNPEICPVGDLHRIFSQPFVDKHIRTGCLNATIRCDECKQMCGTSIYTVIHPMQERRHELENKPDTIWEVLENGSQRAQQAAESVMKDVRAVMGLSRNLSGINIAKNLPPEERAEDVRDLSTYKDWMGLAQTVLTRNVSELWRRQILPPQIPLKQDSGEMWLTQNNRRVCIAASYIDLNLNHWRLGVQPKSYEILILLCLDEAHQLYDFIVPQKLYLAFWVAAKKQAGKGLVWLEVRKHESRFLLRIGSSDDSIDITDTEREYGIL
jgi:tryptophanyl-tRNA synthetase